MGRTRMETVGVILCAVIMALSSTEVVQSSAGTLWAAYRTGRKAPHLLRTWGAHVDPFLVSRFAQGMLPPSACMSVEMHVKKPVESMGSVLCAGVLPEIGMGWVMYSILGKC